MIERRRLACVFLLACVLATVEAGIAAQQGTDVLKRMSLEDLLGLDVTTVTRRPEPAGDIPAALFVITNDDIRRAGATSLPEALRLAPGVQVARLDGSRWATGVRGVADRLSRAMLVLIDGRAVYSPLFAGTYWEVQDVLLEDVERIEVIKGPGGTLWGANAVNGVINIIMKDASRTRSPLVSGDVGQDGQFMTAVRVGGGRDDLAYRMYAKAQQHAHELRDTGAGTDGSRLVQAGGRVDWATTAGRAMTLQGDIYAARLGEVAVTTTYVPPYRTERRVDAPLAGGNVLGRLRGTRASGASYQFQFYYDRTSRDEVPVGERRDTADLDYQQTARAWRGQQITFGGGYRVTSGLVTAVAPSALVPARRTDSLFSAFVQDEVPLVGSRLRAMFGAKIEHNAYSGLEVQPSARLTWSPVPTSTVFGAVTRAVRAPSRVETDYTTTSLANPTVPTFVRLAPNPGFRPESLVAYEAGYRVRSGSRAFVTVSAFYNSLNDVLSTELMRAYPESLPGAPTHTILEVMFRNGLFGETHGAEVTADLRPWPQLRGTVNYAYVKVAVTRDPGALDVSQERRYEGITPRHQVQAQLALELPRHVSLDTTVRRVSALAVGPVPAFTTLGVRLGWQVTHRIELSVVGQDLNRAQHLEWPGGLPIVRRVFGRVVFRRP